VTALVLFTLAGLLLYGVACVIWPFAACVRCSGNGKLRSPGGKAWRTCKRCGGSGARLRIGRVVWNALRGARDHL
jgi:hypothetical protein